MCLGNGHGVEKSISFGYNRQIICRHFIHILNLVIFTAKVNGFKVFCVGNSSYNFMVIHFLIYGC